MVYITGDTHGEVLRFTDIENLYGLTANDMMIVAGDFGCIFGHPIRDEERLDVLVNCRIPSCLLTATMNAFRRYIPTRRKHGTGEEFTAFAQISCT